MKTSLTWMKNKMTVQLTQIFKCLGLFYPVHRCKNDEALQKLFRIHFYWSGWFVTSYSKMNWNGKRTKTRHWHTTPPSKNTNNINNNNKENSLVSGTTKKCRNWLRKQFTSMQDVTKQGNFHCIITRVYWPSFTEYSYNPPSWEPTGLLLSQDRVFQTILSPRCTVHLYLW